MSLLVLYLLLLKATVTSFSGLSSLPMIRHDLVVTRHSLTDRQLNAAVVVGQSSPGPFGLYIVAVGYFAAGIPGAIAGWLALITPALVVIPMLRYAARHTEDPRLQGVLRAVIAASAGLTLSICVPLARDAITGWLPAATILAATLALILTRVETVWVILLSAAVSLLALWR
jgi:chromate transporter